MSSLSLEALFERYLQDRDERAMEELVARSRPRLLAIARRIDGGREAEDCVQTAYLSLMYKQAGEMEAPILPWLITAVVRIAYGKKATRERREVLAQKLTHVPGGNEPVGAAMDSEHTRYLHELPTARG